MRQRREVAGCADRSLRRDPRRHTRVDKANQRLDHAQANPGKAARQAVNFQHHNQTREVVIQRFAYSRRVRQHQRALQVFQVFGRDAGLRQQAKTGVDTVGGATFRQNRVNAGDAVINRRERAFVEGEL